MSEPKWTKGPWQIAENIYNSKPNDPWRGAIKIEGDVNGNWGVPPLICALYRGEDTTECANLIAAAPDLYEALQRLIVECGEGGKQGRAIDLLPRKTIDLATAALSRARGE